MSHSSRSHIVGRHQSPDVRQGPLEVAIGPCAPWNAIQWGEPSRSWTVASSGGRYNRSAIEHFPPDLGEELLFITPNFFIWNPSGRCVSEFSAAPTFPSPTTAFSRASV